jgi:hypothetical protein
MIFRFTKENIMKNGVGSRGGNFSVFNLSCNFSIDLRLDTHYESNVITESTTITKIHFFLRIVSAELHTNRSETRH